MKNKMKAFLREAKGSCGGSSNASRFQWNGKRSTLRSEARSNRLSSCGPNGAAAGALSLEKKSVCMILIFISSFFIFSGCIRLTGTAGYWHKGPKDEEPKSRSVTLDTEDLVDPNRPKGNIVIQ